MICWILINYNGSEITAHNYDMVLANGVRKDDVFLVDNGSVEIPDVDGNILSLPGNIKFRGAAELGLRYCTSHDQYSGFVILTNSGELVHGVDYLENFSSFLGQSRVGFVVSSLSGDSATKYAVDQAYNELHERKGINPEIFHPQPILTYLSREFVVELMDQQMSYFNRDLVHGWGIDREMRYACDKFGYMGLVSHGARIIWNNNLIHKLGRAGQTRNDYWTEAEYEMRRSFTSRYGSNWEVKFKQMFENEVGVTSMSGRSGRVYNYYRLLRSRIWK